MDCSLPGSSVHGILQAKILEWVAIPFSKEELYTDTLITSLPEIISKRRVEETQEGSLGCVGPKR